MLTICTPTYNRADTLPRLYESLKNQSSLDFEWIIIDDGSLDNTKEIVQTFISEGVLNIIYRYRENGGKMRAVNQGVTLARGEFFFIVDSDDYVSTECVEKILFSASSLPKNLGGIVFRKINIGDNSLNINFPAPIFDSSPIETFYRKGILGDKAEVLRTSLMRENPFPEIQGEKFVPEGYIWNKIGEKYGFRYVDEPIYFFEYLESGYTKNFERCMRENPKGFSLYYREMLSYSLPLKQRLKFLARFLQCLCFIGSTGGKR